MQGRLSRGAALAWMLCAAAMAASPRPVLAAPPLSADEAATKAAYEGLPEAERRALQEALIWTGDYTGVISGSFGPRTRDAIAAYAKRLGLQATDALAPASRARVEKQAEALKQAIGFAPVKDKRAGFIIALPLKLLPKQTGTDSGSRYSSADGSIVVDTLARPAGAGGLGEIFDRMSASAGPRKVTYKLSRPDFFVVSGEIGERKFYSRYASGAVGDTALVRGFTLAYAKDAARMDAIALAVAASFDPFPAPDSATTAGQVPPTAALAKPKPAPAPAGPSSQAVVIAPGLAVAFLSSRMCPAPQVAGTAAGYRLQDDASGLALLSIAAGAGQPLALASGAPDGNAPLYVAFHAEPGPDGKAGPIYVAAAEKQSGQAGMTVSAPLQGGAAGTPILDRSGALAGLAQASRAAPPVVAGTVLAADYRVTDAAEIKALLAQASVTLPAPAPSNPRSSLGDVVASLGKSLVNVSCGPVAASSP